MELVDAHAGFDDFDDRDAVAANLFNGVGDEGMKGGDVQSVGDKGEKEREEEFHRRNQVALVRRGRQGGKCKFCALAAWFPVDTVDAFDEIEMAVAR